MYRIRLSHEFILKAMAFGAILGVVLGIRALQFY